MLTMTKTMRNLVKVLNEYFNHNVLEFNVHHGCHSFLLRAHQRGPKDDAQVGHSHQVELALCGNSAKERHTMLQSVFSTEGYELMCGSIHNGTHT